MEVKKKIILEIEGKDAETLKSAIKKVSKELAAPGLKNNTITTEEADILKTLNDNLQ